MTDPIVTAARFLAENLDWIRHRPEADEFLTDVEACLRILRGVARGPAEQRYLGPCGAEHPERTETDGFANWTVPASTCDGDVYAREGAERGRCRTCGAEVATQERRAWLDDEVRAHAFRAAHIADAYRINVKTIRSWADRGHLLAHGEDRDGRPLYNVGDVLDLAAGDAARREGDRATRARRAAARAAESEQVA